MIRLLVNANFGTQIGTMTVSNFDGKTFSTTGNAPLTGANLANYSFNVAQTGPILSLMPIFVISIVFGLAMDYQVFLVTRIRAEYVHGTLATQAIIDPRVVRR